MPKFSVMDPKDVLVPRARIAAEERKAYVAALQSSDAGQIQLDRGEIPSTVKRRLADAATELGIKVRSSWTDAGQRTLVWKRSAGHIAVRKPRAAKK